MEKIYCDAGKPGSANNTSPTRLRVTDQDGNDILDIANARYNGHQVFEFPDFSVTNNFGELVAITIAMRLAVANNVKVVCTDSNVATWWVQGKGKELKKNSVYWEYYTSRTSPMYDMFIAEGGSIKLISGAINKADLGDHK